MPKRGTLGQQLAERMAELTLQKTADIGLRHAEANRPYIRKTIEDLDGGAGAPPRPTVVVSAGPSLHLRRGAERLKGGGFDGVVVAADGGLGHCLRAGLVPDFVVSVDPHPTRMVRLFGDPELERRPPDDYFQRQDLYPQMVDDEVARNRELLELVDRHGPQIQAVLSTSVSPAVSRRVLDAGMTAYWWNPIYDDYDAPESLTRRLFELTGAPCMATGGNVGAAAWVFAGAVLRSPVVALLGMDLSYAPGTPLTLTQYYRELRNLFGDRVVDAYIQVTNPHLGETWYTDPTYWWYRETFLEMAQQAPCVTYNCTEGGILFGSGVRWSGLEDFLEATRHGR